MTEGNTGPSTSRPIVIYGASRLGRLMYSYLTSEGTISVAGFTVDREFLANSNGAEPPLHAFEDVERHWPPDTHDMFVALGYRRMRDRAVMFARARAKGYRLINHVSARAIVADDLCLGENNVIMPGVQIEPGVRIGDNNLFWSQTLVCHEVVIGNHNYFSARCLIAGGTSVGDLCFFGNGCITINDLAIGDETQALPGSVLYRRTRPYTKYMGSPAQAVGSHEADGIIIERG